MKPKLLVSRKPDDMLAQELKNAGLPVVCAPVTVKVPSPSEDWYDPMKRLQDGEFEWVVISSVTTAKFLSEYYVLSDLFAHTKVAAVGTASAQAIELNHAKVDLVGPNPASAASLVETFPEGSGAVFLPCAAGAAPTLGQGLNQKGYDVEKLCLYETIPVEDLPVEWEKELSTRGKVFALITAGSVARAAHRLMSKAGVAQWPTPIAFGAASAEVLRELGWPAAEVCKTANYEGVVDAYDEVISQIEKKSD